MPDFRSIIVAMQERTAEIKKEEEQTKIKNGDENTIQDKFDSIFSDKKKPQKEQEQPLNFNPNSLGDIVAGTSSEDIAERRRIANQSYGGDESLVESKPMETGGWGATAYYQDFLSKSGDNIMVGIGNSIFKSTGDMVDALGAMIVDDYSGNPFSEAMKEIGTDMAEKYKTYISPEMLSPEFKISTFMNPEFWSVHGAQFVPQLLEILLTKNVAKAGARGVSNLGRKAALEIGEEGMENLAKKGLRTTTTRSIGGAVSEVESNALRWSGKLFRDTGELTNFGRGIVETGIGGLTTNLSVGLKNAGELWNTVNEMKDEQGNPMFTKEEMSQMTAGAFTNNMKYLAMDTLSWGMTFGGGWNKLSKAASTLSPASQLKMTSGMFTHSVSPIFSKLGKLAGKAIPEGLEETIQESYEEWSKMKAYKDVTGTLKGYPGLSQDYDTSGAIGDFWSYYTSKDSEAIRAISFGLGAAAGGAFNFKSIINEAAEQNYAYYSKAENLKKRFEKGTTGKAFQDTHIRNQMAEIVFEDKDYAFGSFIGELENRGVISEEDVIHYNNLYSEMKAQKDNIEFLNISGKRAFMNNITKEMDIVNKINIAQQKHEKNTSVLKETFQGDEDGFNKAMKKELKAYNEEVSIFGNILSQIQQNKRNILKGEPAVQVEYETKFDENGNEIVTQPESTKSEKVQEEQKADVPVKVMKDSMFNRLSDLGKKALENLGITFDTLNDTKTKEEVKNDDTSDVNDDSSSDYTQDSEYMDLEQERIFYQAQTDESYLENENKALEKELASIEDDNDPRIAEIDALMSDNEEQIQLRKEASELSKNQLSKSTKPEDVISRYEAEEKLKSLKEKIKPVTRKDWSETESGKRQEEIKNKSQSKVKNDKIIDDEKTTLLDEDVYKSFVDNGTIPSGVINSLVDKISENQELTPEEKSVRQAFSNEVENLLKQKAEVTEDYDKEIEDDYDMSDDEQAAIAEYEKKAVRRKKTKKSISEDSEKKNKELLKKAPEKKDGPSNIFGSGRAKTMSNTTQVAMDKVEKAKSVFGGIVNKFKAAYEKDKALLGINKKEQKLKDTIGPMINPNNMDEWLKDSLTIGQEFAVNQKLAAMFPDANVHVSVVQDLHNAIGFRALGYSLRGAMFVDSNSWKQHDVLMHEMAHVYYEFMKDDTYTNAIINHGMKNKQLVDKIRKEYASQVFYKFKSGKKATYQNMLEDALMKGFTREQFDITFEKALASGNLKEAPMAEQDILREEIFAYGLEGPLSRKFGNLLEPNLENTRQFFAKKWWGKIKEKVTGANSQYSENEKLFLANLSDSQLKDFDNAKEKIFENFQKELKGRNVEMSAVGKAKAIDKFEAQIKEQHEEIQHKLEKQLEKFEFNKNTFSETQDDELDLEEMIGDEKFFDHDRLKYGQKASEMIRKFFRSHNRVIRRKFMNDSQKNGGKTNWFNIPFSDKDKFERLIIDAAKTSPSNLEFIRRIENSDIYEIDEFNKFLNTVRPEDKYLILSSMKFIYGNQSKVNSVIGYMDSNGNYQIQNNLSAREDSMVESAVSQMMLNGGAYFGSTIGMPADPKRVAAYQDFIALVEKIKSDNYTNADLREFLKAFSSKSIEVDEILQQNLINVNGNNYTIDQVVREVIKKGFDAKTSQGNNAYSINDSKRNFKNIFRQFAKAIAVTNRKFTNTNTVLNAMGDQVPVRVIDNMFIRTYDDMNKDAEMLSKSEFIKKYSAIHTAGKGSMSNRILNHFWDKVREGNKLDVNLYHGTKNDMTKNNSVVSDSNSTEQSIMEALSYFADNRSNEYLMEAGRFADSPVSYMIRVPKTKLAELGTMKNGKFVFKQDMTPTLENALATYNGITNSKLTMAEFKDKLNTEIQKEIEFAIDNREAFQKSKSGEQMFDSDNKITDVGRNMIAEYTINQSLNSLAFNDIFMPSYSGKDIVKRQKSLHSPIFSFGKHVRVEPIYYVDKSIEEGQKSVSDSSMYVLREDAELIRKAGGNMMPLNNSYKILMTGREFENQNFAKGNLYDKGYATIIDEELVAKNPELKGLFEFMKARRERFNRRNFDKNNAPNEHFGPNTLDLLNGESAHIMFAAPVSSVKSDNMPISLVEKGSYNPTETGQMFTLEGLNSGIDSNFEEQSKIYDDWHYGKVEGTNWEKFVGINGSNFGVQQVMDMKKTETNTPIQAMRAILTNASLFEGGIQIAEEIQSLLTEQMVENLSEYKEVLKSRDPKKIREFLIGNDIPKGKKGHQPGMMNMMDIEARQRFLIEDDKASMSLPDLQTLAMNTMINAIRKNGNKLSTPGTIAQAKSDTYQKPYSTNGTTSLAFYTDKTITDAEGNVKTIYNQGEAVVPSHMQNKVKARKYYTINDLDVQRVAQKYNNLSQEDFLGIIESLAKKEAMHRGTSVGEVRDNNGEIIGYYAAGDSIIATRIPSHGPQTTGVFEVIDFDPTGAANVQLPAEFALDITGGDFDGDQFFIQHKGKGSKNQKWNKAFDKLTNLWLGETMRNEVRLTIDFKEEAEQAVKAIHGKDFGKDGKFHFSPQGRREAYNNTLVSKNNIGVAANLHSLLGMLAGYETKLVSPIRISGYQEVNTIKDTPNESRTINSAKIFNLILDNAKNQYADALGINEHTVSHAIILRNLGISLEDIGRILNSDVVKEMNKLLSNNENIFKDSKSVSDIERIVRAKIPVKSKGYNGVVNLQNLNSPDSQHAILDLMGQVGSINEDIMAVSAIMSGHNKIETNPFILDEQYKRFRDKVMNVENKGIEYNQAFLQNPLLQNYVSTFEFAREVMGELDPVYSASGKKVFKRLAQGIGRNLSNKDINKIHSQIQMLMTARSMGLNNVPEDRMKELIRKSEKNNPNPNNIFERLEAYKNMLGSVAVQFKDGNVQKTVSALQHNLLFSKGLMINSKGNNRYIALNSSYFNENMNSEERQRMVQEFNDLPTDIKNDLMIYDMFTNGFKGPRSLYSIFSDGFKMQLSLASDNLISQKQSGNYKLSAKQESKLTQRIVQTNSEMFVHVNNKENIFDNNGNFTQAFLKKNGNIFKRMAKGEEVIFRYKKFDDNNRYSERVFHFGGISKEQAEMMGGFKEEVIKSYLGTKLSNNKEGITFYATYPANMYSNGIGVVAIPDSTTGNPRLIDDGTGGMNIEEIFNSATDMDTSGRAKKEFAKDYYRYTEKLSKEEFIQAMDIKTENLSDTKIDNVYKRYEADKKKADAISKTVNSETVKTMSDEKLIELYSGKRLSDGEPGYGHRDKFAYANVIRPIILEIAKRAGVEQAQLAKTNSDKEIGYGNEDLGFFQSYLMANNIPSNQPEIQALVRKMEVEFKKLQTEKAKLTADIQTATEELYKEKFGFNPGINKVFKVDFWKNIWNQIYTNKEDMYKNLYGSLIVIEKVMGDNGRQIDNMKYKTPEQIEADFKSGIVSPAQYKFYKATTEMTKKMKPFVLGEEDGGRVDYIPHSAPTMLEIKARRGLLGMAVNSKNINERVGDVLMTFTNPISGKAEENVPFSHIQNVYNTLSATNKKEGIARTKEFLALKRKAIILAREMKNQDGSTLKISEVEAGSAIGDVFLDRFSNSRSIAATDLPTLDLNKAFMDYAHSTLFNHGNENFQGMNKMLPLVDGIIALSDSRNDLNAKNYVEKVWKEYFLSGKKQTTFKNSATLEAVGITSDKAVDLITKTSLVYWLGYQGLLVGGGVYAVGNLLTGKYMNIKNNGGVAWALGEKRFWGGVGGFNPLNPFKGVKEANAILKNVGFMDINVYDEVSISEKSSLEKSFMNMALFPMIYSEKWIQGVDFLGRLTEEEWNTLKDGGKLSDERMTSLENEVKTNHGKGYQATDQRMIQMYSWGRNLLQFSRYIPTLFYDQFATKDVNIYGKKHIGSYRAVGDVIQKVVRGEVKPTEFFEYRKNLDAYDRKRLDQGLIGFGMLSLMWGLNISGDEHGHNKYFADSNPLLDLDKMESKLTPPSYDMIDKVF